VKKIIYILTLTLFICGCSSDFKTESEFYKWWNDKANGLVKEKEINDFRLIVKYMPAEYLAFNELKGKNYSKSEYDDLYDKYKSSRTFLLSILPSDEKSTQNVLYYNLENFADYKKRILEMNFSPGDFISLKTDCGIFKPVLSTMENVYNIDAKKSIYLVFADNEENQGLIDANELDFVFEDYIFETGINHFFFNKNNLDNIPGFNFLKL